MVIDGQPRNNRYSERSTGGPFNRFLSPLSYLPMSPNFLTQKQWPLKKKENKRNPKKTKMKKEKKAMDFFNRKKTYI